MIRCGSHTQYLHQGLFIMKISSLTSKKVKEICENFRVASAELNFRRVKKKKTKNVLVC